MACRKARTASVVKRIAERCQDCGGEAYYENAYGLGLLCLSCRNLPHYNGKLVLKYGSLFREMP